MLLDKNTGLRWLDLGRREDGVGFEIEPFLHRLESMPKHLLAYYEANSGALMKRRLNNAFWDAGEPGYETVFGWITNPRVSNLIFKAYGLSPGRAE